jgi:hypothetical protein
VPGAEYEITCTACDLTADAFNPGASTEYEFKWPATLGEFFGERGGRDCRYCPECGYIGEQRHFFKLVCGDCGRRDRRYSSMTTSPDRCACDGERSIQLAYGRTPTCPDHPEIELQEMSLIELDEVNGGVTSVPCRVCRKGTLVVGGVVTLMD